MGARLASTASPWFSSAAVESNEARAALATAFATGTADALLVEGGVLPSVNDTGLRVTSTGTTSAPKITAAAGRSVIPVSAQHGWVCTYPETRQVDLAVPPSTNPRIDLVVAAIDTGVAYIQTIDGTPASSPVAPAVPAAAIPLAHARVETTGAVTITDKRYYTRGPGGIRRADNDSNRAGSYPWDLRQLTDGTIESWSQALSVWQPLATPAVWKQFTPVLRFYGGLGGTVNLGSGGVATCDYMVIGKRMEFSYRFAWGTGPFNGGTGSIETNLPPGITLPNNRNQWTSAHLWVNTPDHVADYLGGTMLPKGGSGARGVRPWFTINLTDNRIAPYTIASTAGTAGTGVPAVPGFPEGGELHLNGVCQIA